MNFVRLVEKLILENTPAPATGSPAPTTGSPAPVTTSSTSNDEQQDNIIATTAKEYLSKNKGEIEAAYNDAFKSLGVNVFPSAEFDTIVYNVCKNSVRATKDYKQIPKFVVAYPIIDLASQIKQTYVEKGDEKQADQVLDNWLKKLKTPGIPTPLDFPATDPWTISVKQAFEQAEKKASNIGTIKLDQYGAVSIADGIYKLMAQRASAGIWKLPKDEFNPSELGKNVDAFLQKILENPTQYSSGVIPFPDAKMKAVYGEETPKMVLNVSNAARDLFEQQFNEKILRFKDDTNFEIVPTIYDPKSKKVNETAKQEAYKFFLNNKIVWSTYIKPTKEQTKPELQTQSFNFDDAFNVLFKNISLLSEGKTDVPYKAESGKEYYFRFDLDYSPKDQEDDSKFSIIDAKSGEILKTTTEKEIQAIVQKFKEGQEGNEPLDGTVLIQHLNQLKLGSDDILAQSAAKTAENILKAVGLEKNLSTQPQQNNPQIAETFIEGKYSIADIKKYKDENQKAEVLYEALDSIANFIRNKLDWESAGKAAQGFFKALSFGSPQVGGKR